MSVILRGGGADTHASASPGAVDYVLDEVKADSTAVAVFDGAASATLSLQSTRLGAGATAGINATAVGYLATASGLNSTAVRGTASGVSAVSVGAGSSAAGSSAVAVGATATGSSAVAVGASSVAGAGSSIAIGQAATVAADDDDAGPNVAAASSIAIGTTATVELNCTNAVAIGPGAIVKDPAAGGVGTSAVSLGYQAETRAASSIAIGHAAVAGDTAAAKGTQAIAIGYTATAGHDYDIAIGSGATSSTAQPDGIAIGRAANAGGEFCVSIGKSATSSGRASVCLGAGTSGSTFTDVIALGSSHTGAVVSATTATTNGEVIVGSGGSGATGYLRGNQIAQTYTITAATNDIVPTSAGNATLTAGEYTPTALAAHAQTAMNAQIAGAGFTVTYSTSTELYTFSRGSAFTMAWGAAGTAFAVFGFPQTTTASATSQVGTMVRPDAADLSPAVAAGVELGTPFRAYGKLYVDAIYPRTRLTDYIRLTMTQTSGGGGAWSNSTSASHIVFPGSTAATFSVSSVAAPGSAFSNGSTTTAFAARYTYHPSAAYSRVLVTVSVNNFRGSGPGTGNVNMTIGAGGTAAGMTTSGPFQFTNALSRFGSAQLTTVLDLSAADRFFGPMWLVESGTTVLAGTGAGIETATIVILVV